MIGGYGGLAGILAFIPNPIVSTNEACFLSNTEKIHELFIKISEIIDQVNTFGELFNELKGIIETFDDTVKEEVTKYIQEMYENGELKDIIEELVTQNIINELRRQVISSDVLPIQRFETRWRDSGMYQFRYDTSIGNSPELKYPVVQGGCTFVKNGIRYFLVAYISKNTITNNVLLTLFRQGTYAPIFSITQNLGHCNGLTYDVENDYVYAAHSSEYDESDLGSPTNTNVVDAEGSPSRITTNKISRLHLSWSDTQEEVINDGDFETKIFNKHAYDVEYDNGTLYAFVYTSGTKEIGTIDWENGTITRTHNLNDITFKGTLAGFTINDNYIAINTFSPNSIYILDKTNDHPTFNNGLIQIMRTPLTIENIDSFGELEWATLENNGDLYLGSFVETQGAGHSELINFEITKSNIYKGINRSVEQVAKNVYSRSIYVVIKSVADTTYASNILHCDGSKAHPYPTVQHAINSIENDEKIKSADIRVYADTNTSFSVWYRGSKTIEIIQYSTANFEDECDSSNSIFNNMHSGLGGVFADGAGHLILRGCYVIQRHSVLTGDMYGSINLTNCFANIRSCKTSTTLIASKYGNDNAKSIYFIGSVLLYRFGSDSLTVEDTNTFASYSPALRVDGSRHITANT